MTKKGKTILIGVTGLAFIICGFFTGNGSSSSSNSSSSNSTKNSPTIEIGKDYDCPHCYGTGQRTNGVTGQKGSCSSCGGDGHVSKEQYDMLSK